MAGSDWSDRCDQGNHIAADAGIDVAGWDGEVMEMTPREAIAVLGRGERLSCVENREMAELILRLDNVLFLAAKASVEWCESCEVEIKDCEGSENVHCVNKVLRSAIKTVKA